MNYAQEYIESNKLKAEVCDRINYMRIYKKIVKPAEIVSDRGHRITEYYKTLEVTSLIEWQFQFPDIPKPTLKAKRSWHSFKN